MKPHVRRLLFAVIAFCVLVAVAHSFMAPSIVSAAPPRPIQYKVVPTNTSAATQQQLTTILQREGQDGWELIDHYGTAQGDVLIFKK